MQAAVSSTYKSDVDVHGLSISFETDSHFLYERFLTIYGHLPSATETDDGVSIQWQLHNQPMAPLPPPATPAISEDRLVSHYGNNTKILIRMPKYGLLTVDFDTKRISGVVTRNCLDVYGAFEDVMLISLAPLYRRRGWFPLHAFAALTPNGKTALITGQMGAGKTTTGLSLLCAGWKLLSNDSPLLHLHGNSVEVLAYPGQLSAFDDSLARFERLKKFIPAGENVDRQKRVFNAEEAFKEPWADAGLAGGVFFPQVVPGLEHSELVPVSPAEAMVQLMPQGIEGWDKATMQQSLQLLGKLVEQAPCYILRLSPRVEQLPELIGNAF